MKHILFSAILIASLQTQAEGYFANTNSEVEATNLTAKVQEGHRVLALLARMSVYALSCGDQTENTRFSAVYRSLFTEERRGMVSYDSQTFSNPIEGMRNEAMLTFLQAEQRAAAGRTAFCNQNRVEFRNFLYMSANQIKAYVQLSDSQQSSYLMTVRSTAQSSVQSVEQPEIQIDPDSE